MFEHKHIYTHVRLWIKSCVILIASCLNGVFTYSFLDSFLDSIVMFMDPIRCPLAQNHVGFDNFLSCVEDVEEMLLA